jgi:hypothetical protein
MSSIFRGLAVSTRPISGASNVQRNRRPLDTVATSCGTGDTWDETD